MVMETKHRYTNIAFISPSFSRLVGFVWWYNVHSTYSDTRLGLCAICTIFPVLAVTILALTTWQPSAGAKCPDCPVSMCMEPSPSSSVVVRGATQQNYTSKRPLNLVFLCSPIPRTNGGLISETEWIRDILLSKLRRPVIVHTNHTTNSWSIEEKIWFTDDSLVVLLFSDRMKYVTKAREAGVTNLGIFQMGDEGMKQKVDFIEKADYVLRNYYNKPFLAQHPNVHWVPLGIHSGIGAHAVYNPYNFALTSQRKHHCTFFGVLWKDSDRKGMMDTMNRNGIKCKMNVLPKWEEPKASKHPIEYRFQMENSKFTLCPHGKNPETLRLYEALHLGTIPITKHFSQPDLDPLTAFGTHPIPVFSAWREAALWMQEMLQKPEELDALQQKIMAWWAEKRESLVEDVAAIIENSFANKYGADM
eukprot:gene6071-1086_t